MKIKTNAIMFHHFTDGKKYPKEDGAITSLQFERILTEEDKFKILDASDWLYKFQNNLLKANEYCITFDDNLKCQFDIALPLLKKYKISAFWFVYSSPLLNLIPELELFRYFRLTHYKHKNDFYKDFEKECLLLYPNKVKDGLKNFNPKEFLKIFTFYTFEDRKYRFIRDYILDQEEYLKIVWSIIKNSSFNYKKVIPLLCISKQDLKKISNLGHHIGLHSHTHPTNIARLNSDEQLKEYAENKYVLESIIKKNVISVAHPVNSYNSKTLQILSSLNIKFGFCSNQGAVKYRSNLELPRIDHSEIIKVLS